MAILGNSVGVGDEGRNGRNSALDSERPYWPRKLAALIIIVWATLPLLFTFACLLNRNFGLAIVFGITASASVAAGVFAYSGRRHLQNLSLVLLALLAVWPALSFVQGAQFAETTGASAVADSPAGYLIRQVLNAVSFALLAGAFVAIARRRTAGFEMKRGRTPARN